ncbi:MAG: hypothetical protein L3J93_05550, partial [Thermoplasmata archaeon]|nr:hypothetical protein [Thermoplasmata archaeon]
MPSKTSDDPVPLKAGEFVLLDYEMWAEGGEKAELIDTTREEAAQKANIPIGEGKTIQPHAHLVGGDYFPGGIENWLLGAKIGVEVEKEFPPGEAFGERDPKLIELFSMHQIQRLPEMRREDAELNVGTMLTIEGRRGRVSTLTAARVRVDFNPAFAGRRIRLKALPMNRISEPHD